MAFTRRSRAEWHGDLTQGQGKLELGSGAFSGPYSFQSRFGNDPATNPEELIAAAHAGCFAMALSAALGHAGHKPKRIESSSEVRIEKDETGFTITGIVLQIDAQVDGIDEHELTRIADEVAQSCPVSKALAAVPITHRARLLI